MPLHRFQLSPPSPEIQIPVPTVQTIVM